MISKKASYGVLFPVINDWIIQRDVTTGIFFSFADWKIVFGVLLPSPTTTSTAFRLLSNFPFILHDILAPNRASNGFQSLIKLLLADDSSM